MEILWVGAFIFITLALLFAASNRRGGNRGGYHQPTMVYQPQPPPQPVYQQPFYPQTNRGGCQQVVFVLFIAFGLFAAAVIAFSVAVDAGVISGF